MITTSAFAEGFYVGTYTGDSDSKGIYHGELNSETGAISDLHLAAEAPNPSYLALSPNGKFLYAACEDRVPVVIAFRVETGGKLVMLNQQPAGGESPCHVSVDRSGKFVFVANYSSGSIAAFALEPDGSIGDRTAFVQFEGSGPNRERQASPHAHSIMASPDNRFVYACDLGSDKVWIFKFDAKSGALTPTDPAFASVPGGSGPRHMDFSPDGRFFYTANEMGLDVTAFRRDVGTGLMEPIQTLSAEIKPAPGGSKFAEIELHPSGKWLYVSSRGDDTLVTFSIAPDGKLKLAGNVSSVGKTPRGFAIAPKGRWLLAAGQDDNSLHVFRIDSTSGNLTPTEDSPVVGKPVCILFAE